MAVTLDGVTLNDNMVWLERFKSTQVAQSVKRTLGGIPVVFSGALQKGQPITLEAGSDYGWLQKSVVDQLKTKADVPGAVYSLVYGSENYSVVFRHEEPPALDMQPLIPRVTHVSTDYFVGQIKLMTV